MLRFRKSFLAAVLTGLAVGMLASPVDASFRLRVEDASTGKGTVITDDMLGDSDFFFYGPGHTPGLIVFAGSVGNFTINVTTALSKPIIGGINNLAEMHLNNVSVVAKSGGTLIITLEDTDFGPSSGAGGGNLLGLVADIGGTLSGPGTISANAWLNPNNLVPNLGPDQAVGTIGAISSMPPPGSIAAWSNGFSAGPGSFSSTSSSPGFYTGPAYSLFMQTTVNFASAGNVSWDLNLQVTPVPAGAVLVLAAVPFLGGFQWLRRRKAVKPA